MDRESLTERYRNDKEFCALVDALTHYMIANNVTTHMMRDASFMACLKAESLRPFPRFYTPEDIDDQ